MPSDDDELMTELCRLATRLDPPPPHLYDAARAAFAWRRVDRELAVLAELTSDSADEPGLAGVRSHGTARLLTFDAGSVSVEVEVAGTPRAGRLRLIGQIVPPQPGDVTVRHADGELTVDADELGRFRTDEVTAGPTSLRCRLHSGESAEEVVTEWLTL